MSPEKSKRFRVLCFWPVDPHSPVLASLRQVADVDVREPDADYLGEHAGEYDAYLAGLAVRFDAQIAQRAAAGRMKLVYTPSTGLDHLDLDALKAHNIEMRCIKTEFGLLDQITATAELALTLMLSVARRIPAAHQAAMQGHWARDLYRGHQLAGKTLGVLGVGRLGSMMVEYGRGLRMNVIGCDHAPRKRVADLAYLDWPAFAARADVISVHIHLTPENEHFLNAQRIAQMKPGAILVNTSRGRIVDEAALLDALACGQLSGAGLDVIDGEWRTDLQEHPVIRYAQNHDSVVITPHVGGVTHESQAMVKKFVADQLAAIIRQW